MARLPYTHTKKLLSNKIILLGLFFILCFIIYAIIKNSNREQIITSNTAKLDEEIKNIGKENQELTELIKYLSSSEFADKEAREKLNMAEPDEKVIIIPEENNLANEINSQEKKISNWRLWIKYFFE